MALARPSARNWAACLLVAGIAVGGVGIDQIGSTSSHPVRVVDVAAAAPVVTSSAPIPTTTLPATPARPSTPISTLPTTTSTPTTVAPPTTQPPTTAPPTTVAAPTAAASHVVEASTPAQVEAAAAPNGYGCGPALAWLAGHSAPGFTYECPGYALGHQAMTCDDVAGVCPNSRLIVISDPCPAAYMNEAHNSWIIAGLARGSIDPYGYCT